MSMQKTRIGQFSPKFLGSLVQKLWARPEKVKEVQNMIDVLYAHAKFGGDRWLKGAGRRKTVVFFVCM